MRPQPRPNRPESRPRAKKAPPSKAEAQAGPEADKAPAPDASLSKQPQAEHAEAEQAEPEDDAPKWELDLDTYPLHAPEEDARWAVNTVRIWLGIALFCLLGIITLLILGLYYE